MSNTHARPKKRLLFMFDLIITSLYLYKNVTRLCADATIKKNDLCIAVKAIILHPKPLLHTLQTLFRLRSNVFKHDPMKGQTEQT